MKGSFSVHSAYNLILNARTKVLGVMGGAVKELGRVAPPQNFFDALHVV